MHHELNLSETKREWHGTLRSYLIGFVTSLALTAASFLLVLTEALSPTGLIYTLSGLALAQAVIQLLFFFHLGQEEKPRWERLIFYFMVLMLLIIVGGSLWIMHDLDTRVMSDMAMEKSHD